MIELPTADEEKLKALQTQMDSMERYTEEWFKLRDRFTELFNKIEKSRGKNESSI